MRTSPEFVSEFSEPLETWQRLYKEVVLLFRQNERELSLSQVMIQETLRTNQLLAIKREQLERQLASLEQSKEYPLSSCQES